MKTIAIGLAAFCVAIWSCLSASPAAAQETPSKTDQFIWIGHQGQGAQFTEKEYQQIAANYAYVIFAKYHAGWDINKHHEAARELKKRNPQLKVFPYFSAILWFNQNQFGQDFKEDFYLHDRRGNKVTMRALGQGGNHIDVSNPKYRAWALDILSGWMSLTLPNGKPLYDGICFDAATILNIHDSKSLAHPRIRRLVKLIGMEKIDALNRGLIELLSEVKHRFPDKIIIFNGVADKPLKYNRSLDLFASADAAVDEDFCFRGGALATEDEIISNVNLMMNDKYSSKLFFEKANIKKALGGGVGPQERAQYQRYCYGSFLLGYQPGRTFFKYAEWGPDRKEVLYSVWGELENAEGASINPREPKTNFGKPLGNYQMEGSIYKRDFENGCIYVNMKNTPHKVSLTQPMTLMNGDAAGNKYKAGETFDVPSNDAVFLIK